MKQIKTFGLVALASILTMAFIGASSAVAEPTGLCPTEAGEENPCESMITHVHETSVGKGKLLAGFITVECTVLFLGEVAEEGSPLIIEGHFTYTACGSCSVNEVAGTTAVIEVLRTGHETASVIGEGEVHVNCSGLNCVYNGEGLEGTGKGPLLSSQANGEVTISGQETNKVSGLFCPASAFLDLTTTPLSATYIVGQMLCVGAIRGHYEEEASLYVCKKLVGFPNGFFNLTNG